MNPKQGLAENLRKAAQTQTDQIRAALKRTK